MRTDMHRQRLFQYIQTRDCTNDKMVDSEDIIRAVKRFRAIWDLEDEGYHNKNLKDEAWNGVCLELISDWKVLCEGERYIRQTELKKKWNNIRDYYKKLLSETRPGEQEVRAKKRRYLYSDILEFIRPVYDKRRNDLVTDHSNGSSNIFTHSNNPKSDDQQDSENDAQDTETITFIGIPTKSADRKHKKSSINLRNARRIKRKKSPPMTVFERTLLKTLEKTTKDEDPDLLFLKSLLPDLKKLTFTQKFDFKLGIMELYRNIANASNDQPVVDHDHDYDLDMAEGQIKVETVRLSVDENSYH